jgi:hypothetical protein
MHGSDGTKLSNTALVLSALEVAVLLGAIVIDLASGHRSMLVSRISALSWLLFGGASIVVSIFAITKKHKRSSSVAVAVVCVAIFALCAFRFALV